MATRYNTKAPILPFWNSKVYGNVLKRVFALENEGDLLVGLLWGGIHTFAVLFSLYTHSHNSCFYKVLFQHVLHFIVSIFITWL